MKISGLITVLDDKMQGISNYPELKNFIQPISYIGLTKQLADEAIIKLNNIATW